MKKKFQGTGFLLLLGFFSAMFYSCQKDEDNDAQTVMTITASNIVNSPNSIAIVKCQSYNPVTHGYDYTVAETPFANGGFTLTLPETVPSIYLKDFWDGEEIPTGISVSDTTAKTLECTPYTYNTNDKETGYFYYANADYSLEDSDFESEALWMYVDKNTKIKGKHTYTEDADLNVDEYNLNLKKGWNLIYTTENVTYNSATQAKTYTFKCTNAKPSYTFNWYYYKYYTSYSYTKSAQLKEETAHALRLFSKRHNR